MKFCKTFILLILSATILYSGNDPAIEIRNQMHSAIGRYYQNLFSVEEQDLRITIRRISEPELPADKNYNYQVFDTRNKKRLGYQTIWVNISAEGKLITKIPVSLQVEIRVPVLRTNRKISRRELMTSEMFLSESRYIDSDWNSVIRTPAEVIGLTSRRVIRAGEILDRRMVEEPPVVERGDRIKLEIHSGSMVVGTICIVKDDASIGERVDVVSEPGGKKMKATIMDDGLAIVIQE